MDLEGVGKMKVAELRKELEANSLSAKGNKAELLKRLKEHLAESGQDASTVEEEEMVKCQDCPRGQPAQEEVEEGNAFTTPALPLDMSVAKRVTKISETSVVTHYNSKGEIIKVDKLSREYILK